MSRRLEILDQIASFPSWPPSARLVVDWIAQPQRSQTTLWDAIQSDTVFCREIRMLAETDYFLPSTRGAIFETNNSPMPDMRLFSLATMVGSIHWIVSLGKTIPPSRYWDHSLTVALGMEKLVEMMEMESPDYLFATGFLHDVGKMVMDHFPFADPITIIRQAEEKGLSVDEVERQILGIDHMEIGAILLGQWNFPLAIIEAIRWHHLPDSFPGDSRLLDIVHVADAISLMMGIGLQSEGLNYQTSSQTKDRLNLNVKKIEELIFRIQEELDLLRQSFSRLIGEAFPCR